MKSRIRTHKKNTREQTPDYSTAPAQPMFQSRSFVVQTQQAQQSKQPDLKTALQRAKRYGHNIKRVVEKEREQGDKRSETNQQSQEGTSTQLKREKKLSLEDSGRGSLPVIQRVNASKILQGKYKFSRKWPFIKSGNQGSGQQQQGTITNFRTQNLTGSGGVINHTLTWDSSTGNLRDLGNVYTRERVSWARARPEAFGALLGPGYDAPGQHTGIGFTLASQGTSTDTHNAWGAGGNPTIQNGESAVFTMNQEYQYRVGTDGEWQAIPNSRYTITRRLTRTEERTLLEITKVGVDESVQATSQIDLTSLLPQQ